MHSRTLLTLVLIIASSLYLFSYRSQSAVPVLLTGLWSIIAKSQIQDGHNILSSTPFYQDVSEDLQTLFPYNTSSRSNSYLAAATSCHHVVNPITQHIRIPKTSLLYFHMNIPETAPSTNNYFNPTILTLPSWAKYEYILFTRLVTLGLHQETHFCPASFNLTTHVIHCKTAPQRLNIPSTAAYRCTGAWSSFADIPGFHDPRVFWSGKGEPLIIVNSASSAPTNGCVGLWVVDLRVVIPELSDWIAVGQHDRTGPDKVDEREKSEIHKSFVQPKMSYPYLTEITRNPRSSRSPVEKNWVLFFPKGEDSWVMYDMLGYESMGEQYQDYKLTAPSSPGINASQSFETGIADANQKEIRVGADNSNATNLTSTKISQTTYVNDNMFPTATSPWTSNTTDDEPAMPLHHRLLPRSHSGQVKLNPSRSFAKLIGAGLTTPNLTSPFEPPCFDDSHARDSLNISGRWHQGSNSLRLVLCRRGRAWKVPPRSDTDECILTPENEMKMVESGRIVHFMVMHRKFANELDLPLRYERYFLFWEARWPFHILGVSKYPILFAGERARPWSTGENWPREQGDAANENTLNNERMRWNEMYFTYTPSLAWAHQARGTDVPPSNTLNSLGTGYLDDQLLVGIGMDDTHQGFVRLNMDEVLNCLRLCPYFDSSSSDQ